MTNDRRNFLAGLGITAGGAALGVTKGQVIGLVAAQPTTEEKPFLHIPEDVSPEFQAYLLRIGCGASFPNVGGAVRFSLGLAFAGPHPLQFGERRANAVFCLG
jgi:hypothetical protein